MNKQKGGFIIPEMKIISDDNSCLKLDKLAGKEKLLEGFPKECVIQ